MSGCAAGDHTNGLRSEGRFRGHRVNCEQVPFLPAWAVAWVLDDPRKIPYLFVWKRPEDSSVREVVRVFAYSEPPREFPVNWTGWVEIKHPDGTRDLIRTLLRPLPRNGGQGPASHLSILQNSAQRIVRMGAGRTVHFARHAINLGMP